MCQKEDEKRRTVPASEVSYLKANVILLGIEVGEWSAIRRWSDENFHITIRQAGNISEASGQLFNDAFRMQRMPSL